MVGPSRKIRFAVTLLYGLSAVIAVAAPRPAAAANSGEGSYVCGHRFEPGPIVNGHNRQPTPSEFEARTRELDMLSKGILTAPMQGQDGTCRTR